MKFRERPKAVSDVDARRNDDGTWTITVPGSKQALVVSDAYLREHYQPVEPGEDRPWLTLHYEINRALGSSPTQEPHRGGEGASG
ncbi:MAG TPA: hypothetical protein VD948_02730 [Rhodothermales bacterium]|nr:hypothetical protein [Rhodothermales bacterium]